MAKRSKKTVINTADYEYKTTRIRDKSGKLRYSRGNQDAVAKAMLLHISGGGTLAQVAKANGLEVDLKGKNDGLVRMRIGVALRGLVRNGTPVKIGSVNVKSLKQPVALPKDDGPKAKPAARRKKATKAKSAPRARRKSTPKPAEAPAPEQAAA